jgi:hypothetical protein
MLGYEWSNLTEAKHKPSPSSWPFMKFIDAALKTIGETRIATQNDIRLAAKRVNARGAWDRFDRYVTGSLPPGAREISADEAAADRRRRPANWVD